MLPFPSLTPQKQENNRADEQKKVVDMYESL